LSWDDLAFGRSLVGKESLIQQKLDQEQQEKQEDELVRANSYDEMDI
jgi:hypothetical protein